jgi:hypothetical protein
MVSVWFLILQDSFYRGLTAEESACAQDYNFDHPGISLAFSRRKYATFVSDQRMTWLLIL